MLRLVMPWELTIVFDVLAWAMFHTATGYAAHRQRARLDHDGWLLRPRRLETPARYRRWLRINRWKDKVPQAGDLFRDGTSLRRLPSTDTAGLRAFTRETRRAELAHWWAMGCGLLFALWNPPIATALLIGYGVVVNLPFVAIQRYNRLRVRGLLERRPARPDTGRRSPAPPYRHPA